VVDLNLSSADQFVHVTGTTDSPSELLGIRIELDQCANFDALANGIVNGVGAICGEVLAVVSGGTDLEIVDAGEDETSVVMAEGVPHALGLHVADDRQAVDAGHLVGGGALDVVLGGSLAAIDETLRVDLSVEFVGAIHEVAGNATGHVALSTLLDSHLTAHGEASRGLLGDEQRLAAIRSVSGGDTSIILIKLLERKLAGAVQDGPFISTNRSEIDARVIQLNAARVVLGEQTFAVAEGRGEKGGLVGIFGGVTGELHFDLLRFNRRRFGKVEEGFEFVVVTN